MSDPVTVRFPMACPTCSAVTAMPHLATTPPEGAAAVAMHCRQCGHEWRVDLPASADLTTMRSGVRLPTKARKADDPKV